MLIMSKCLKLKAAENIKLKGDWADVIVFHPHKHNFDLRSCLEAQIEHSCGVDGRSWGAKTQQTQLFCWKLSVEINQRVLEPSSFWKHFNYQSKLTREWKIV